METTLIEFDENESNDSKETIWDIENNEKLQLASFIENQILTKVQLLFDEKDKQIEELRKTNTYLQNKIDDLTLSLENLIYVGISDIKDQLQDVTDIVSTLTKDVANVTDDVAHVTDVMEKITNEVLIVTNDVINVTKNVKKHTNYLSNSYIDLYPNIPPDPSKFKLPRFNTSFIFKSNIKEMDIKQANVDNVLWDLIENFSELNKLTIKLGVTTFKTTDVSIFTKIKSEKIRELVLMDGSALNFDDVLYIYDYIQDMLTNIPNLEILDITCSDGRDPTWMNKFVEKITSIVHKLQKIKLTRGGIVSIDLTKIQKYCNVNNIVLEMA